MRMHELFSARVLHVFTLLHRHGSSVWQQLFGVTWCHQGGNQRTVRTSLL
jgi:hypothetical protein